jgi:plastocyanin
MPWTRTAVIGAATALAIIAAGCGTTKVLAAGRQLTVALTEYRLSPQNVQIDAGPVTISVHNYGRLTHNLVILQDGRPQESLPSLQPGASEQQTVFLPAGRYILASTVQSDQALGVYGTLIVR